MFTGIVDHLGSVVGITNTELSKTFSIQTKFKNLAMGESISVNGVCLTVTAFENGVFNVDLSSETLNRTSLSVLSEGAVVNLERALVLGERLGGHFVTGHVDSTLKVDSIQLQKDYIEMGFGSIETSAKKFIHTKGCIALNGVSLTINQIQPNKEGFKVMLIPHTLERTNLKLLQVGMPVNVEFDWMAKVILERLEAYLPEIASFVTPSFYKERLFHDI